MTEFIYSIHWWGLLILLLVCGLTVAWAYLVNNR